ncbi:MAG: MiaB/RimO family radical SAM methylthiotransferase [Candidatus Gottesmanbacteria bacterium]|nr:MiaB/RimO family radical SAM methylthiotransferase [Candidatus Gottesmanbacteria bacterium]
MKYHIVTFGCAANEADSERIAAFYEARGYKKAKSIQEADDVVINTCMVRQKAEDRVYGLIHNLEKSKQKIILTGCMVGMAVRDSSGRMLLQLKKKLPTVDEFLPIEEVGFDYAPVRSDPKHALVPITNGCNNFCTYCVVPFTRGREVSRPFEDIVQECQGFIHVTLIGQNVNSYGSDLKTDRKPIYVKHLGRLRIPTLFPYLLEEVSKTPGLKMVDFISSNPWDFSDELIDVIARNKNISRHIHLPIQSGDNAMLKRMNRWYTREEYLVLVDKLRKKISGVTISTDIIVGFCGETKAQFNNTVSLAKKVGFSKAYVAMYSDRPMTAAHKTYKDDVPHTEKKRRWAILEELINKTNLKNGTYE